jgi:hypothetical protein
VAIETKFVNEIEKCVLLSLVLPGSAPHNSQRTFAQIVKWHKIKGTFAT